ncbi:unnamed protein product [Rotaria magnacalcarata]
MTNCSHPTAHPRHARGAVLSSIPQGQRRITAQMAAKMNKYFRRRYKGKLLAVKENSLLCETCFAREQRRTSSYKNTTVHSSVEEFRQSAPLAGLVSHSPLPKKIRRSSISLDDPIEKSRSLFLLSTLLVTGKQAIIDFIHNISLTDMSSPCIRYVSYQRHNANETSATTPTVYDWESDKRLIAMSYLFYIAFLEQSSEDSSYNTKRDLLACVGFFLVFGMTQTPDGVFVRPHPALWRLVLCFSVLYEIILIYILFQTVDDARQLLQNIDPTLGVPLPDKDYDGSCRIYDWEHSEDPFHYFKVKIKR